MEIHQVKTRYSNTYVIEQSGAILVVDVANRCDGFVLKFISETLGRSIFDVKLVICTHDDPDHIGGVAALARSCHAIAAIPYASKRPYIKLYQNPLGPIVRIATTTREAFRKRSRQMYMSSERNARYQHVHNHHLETEDAKQYLMPKFRLTHGNELDGFPGWQVILIKAKGVPSGADWLAERVSTARISQQCSSVTVSSIRSCRIKTRRGRPHQLRKLLHNFHRVNANFPLGRRYHPV